MAVLPWLALTLHGGLILLAAPLISGGVAKAEARLSGHRGPPLLQPLRDLQKLLRKAPMVPEVATDWYGAWPPAAFAATAAAALLTPGFCFGMAAAGAGDVISFIGLLALARAATVLAALETGAGGGGAVAARAMRAGIMAEVALLMVALVLALASHSFTLDGIGQHLGRLPAATAIFALLAALMVIALDAGWPTGSGAAGAAEYSGQNLAVLRGAAMLRLTLWLSLLASFAQFGMAQASSITTWPLGILLWAVKLAGLAMALAAVRAVLPEPRAARVPAALGGAALLGLLAIMTLAGPGA